MENGCGWNPERGAHTENANFVTAALEFFDFVREVASADEVDPIGCRNFRMESTIRVTTHRSGFDEIILK